ncbi:TetR/AcrR family transcriptional regulator [Rhodococcoides kyotonense]|uniref:DNA-binding transcriptional regulator, AcrR family n=1 Tax=Rhodococcoides kyotonense TaxID=398843 RepID=A0A239MZ90_9NOCA|nr:TetR/AcrR family transcriptional regulator [Rhodococcus kyotonensis]SNT47512.1 DNA-binding transcriptional regulator, AcrR family [Rhodococcus kyotonensis]
MTTAQAARVRDPERSAKILDAAVELFATRGFHSVAMSDIGQTAGIVGSGIYRHFDSKYAVLVALLDDVMTRLLASADDIVGAHTDSGSTLDQLVRTQIDFCLRNKRHVQLYRQEINALQEDDRRRLRRMQRRYNEEWIATLLEVRPELDDSRARVLVHAAIGAIQSSVTFDSGLPADDQASSLMAVAQSCLATTC